MRIKFEKDLVAECPVKAGKDLQFVFYDIVTQFYAIHKGYIFISCRIVDRKSCTGVPLAHLQAQVQIQTPGIHPVAVFVEIVRFPRHLRPPVEQVAQNVVGHESSRVEIEAEEYVDPLGPIFTSEIERRVAHPVVHDFIEVIMCKRIIQRRIAVTVRIVLVFEIGVGVLHEQIETGTYRHIEPEISPEVVRIHVFRPGRTLEHERHVVMVVHERPVQEYIHPLGCLELRMQVRLHVGALLVFP